MIAVALRSMAQRKLRSALTAVAILLGVAMIAGTYVQTDQIRTAMNDITRTANSGVDAQMSPRKAFTSTFGANDLIDQRTVVRASQVPGAADVQGELFQTGSLVVKGKAVEPKFAPAIVVSAMRAPFDPLRHVSGRLPGQRGEVLVNRKLAEDEHLSIGQRVGVTTRTGIKRVRLVGIADYGNVASIGGATLIVAPMADVQSWYGLEGKVSRVVASAAPGVTPTELVARLRQALPRSLEIKTGEQTAADDAKQANDSIGSFLTPALLAFSGAALLVGAFIIFNTFSISVAQRRREFALLRSIGATRRQVLVAVAAEALVLGVAASVLGLLCGLGFARALGALFDAAGWGIPRGGMQLAPRTIVIGLSVGIGVTLARRLCPGRARDQGAAGRGHARRGAGRGAAAQPPAPGRSPGWSGLAGPRAPGPGPVRRRSGQQPDLGDGARLAARLRRRRAERALRRAPAGRGRRLAAAAPRARDRRARARQRDAQSGAHRGHRGGADGRPRARGLRLRLRRRPQGLDRRRDRRPRQGRARGHQRHRGPALARGRAPHRSRAVGRGHRAAVPRPGPGQRAQASTPSPTRSTGSTRSRCATPTRFRWLHGSDADLQRLVGGAAIVEEQFAKAHGITVGERFRVTGATGHSATLTAIAEYRDPQLMQGVMVDVAQFRALSSLRDPLSYFVTLVPGTDAAAGSASGQGRARRLPVGQGPHPRAVQRLHRRPARPDRLPALRAAGHEHRHLDVRHRQQPLPLHPRAHARARHAARDRRHRRAGAPHDPLRERDHVAHRRRRSAPASGSSSPG